MKQSEHFTKSRLPIAIALVALIISSTALGLQISRNNRGRFSNYMGPATVSDLDYRLLQAQLDIMRGELPIEDGFSPPLVYGLSSDRQKVVVKVFVFPAQLPAKYDDSSVGYVSPGHAVHEERPDLVSRRSSIK